MLPSLGTGITTTMISHFREAEVYIEWGAMASQCVQNHNEHFFQCSVETDYVVRGLKKESG